MSQQSRRVALEASGLTHPHPEAVSAELFLSGEPFFFALDKVQVKYEMLRAHYVEGDAVVHTAAMHGYSRGGFYVVAQDFERLGMAGLLDERRGRKGPVKLTDEVVTFVRAAPRSTPTPSLVDTVSTRFGISLHRRTVERIRRR
ncbi:MAG TPA: helix-turn-helix domain-containing protein [Acidothermaceae bacterium]|nr:helix-turn-helix domain-containing protein [Acidothermaceae bacterium]